MKPTDPESDKQIDPTVPLSTDIEKPGTRIGRYQLLQQLGEGGMGVVYMAQQIEPVSRKVALKIIKPGMDTRQVIARFEAERQALAMMDHPNIAKVLDAGVFGGDSESDDSTAVTSGRPYFVMELVRGVPITQYCDDNKLTIPQRLELFIQTCHAVQHAHQKGIIHRDIKPGNVLVTLRESQPTPVVIDFGIAKAIDHRLTEKTMYTQLGQMIGTPAYMSPEQAGLSGLDVDTRSDIYSLGVLLYELLTGVTPLDLKRAVFNEVQQLIREQEPQKPSTRISSLDSLPTVSAQRGVEPKKLPLLIRGDLDWIVMRSLEKDRTRRYDSANSFAADVQRYLNDEPVEACPPSLGYKLRKFSRRNKVALAVGTSVALILVLATIFSGWQAVVAVAQRDRANVQLRLTEAAEQLAQQRLGEVSQQRDRAEQAEQVAQKEAAIAKAVNDFIQQDLLAQADPSNEPDRDLKLRTVLDRASANIEGRFEGQPLIEAAIRRTLGETYRGLGEYDQAEPHSLRSYELCLSVLGQEDPDTLAAMNHLASLYDDQGKYDQAEPLFTKTLDIRRRTLGQDHPSTLSSMNNLALLYQNLGKYDLAEPLYTKSLETEILTLGQEHRDTLVTMNNLASLYRNQGKYDLAEPLYSQALQIGRRTLGQEHPDTLGWMNNLASLYNDQGNYDQAEPLYTKVLEIRRRTLGQEHPSTLSSMNNLASLYHNQGKYDLAEPLYFQTLQIGRRTLGQEHPDTLIWMNNLATLYSDRGKSDLAGPLYIKVLEVRLKILGQEHPDTLLSLNNLASFYWAEGNYDQAEPLQTKALEIRRRSLGAEHPDTLLSLNNLATVYYNQGKYDLAEPLFAKALEIRRRTLGDEHPDTLVSMNNLAFLYQDQGKYDLAAALYNEALELRRRTLGDEHPDTLVSMNNLANLYHNQSNYDLAGPLYSETLEIKRRTLGQEHSDTLVLMNNLATLYSNQGKYDLAEPLLTESLEIKRRTLGQEHPSTLTTMNILVSLYRAQRKYKSEEELLVGLLEINRRKLDDDDPRLAATLALLGLNLFAQERTTDAEPILRECLTIREKRLPNHWLLFNTQSMLGGAFSSQKKYDEAEPLLIQGYEGMLQREDKIPADGKIRLTEALQRLIDFYESRAAEGDAEKAAKWKAEAEATD